MLLPKILQKKCRVPVAIFGAGVSGKAVEKLLAENGVPATIYDTRAGAGTFANFPDKNSPEHDLCVYSPGFAQNHPWLVTARNAGIYCLTEIDFAASFLPTGTPLTVVTGTNGKTTLTELLAFAHRQCGRVSAAVGNNGVPATSLWQYARDVPARIYFPVCETSSFQAEAVQILAPQSVLWTNFDEDHIDRHGSSENYFRAKFRLIERIADDAGAFPRVCIVGESVAIAAKNFGIALPDFVQIATREEVRASVPAGTIFETFPQLENYALARRYWLANSFSLDALEAAAGTFKPSAHRLEKIAEKPTKTSHVGTPAHIEFWDDSKATNFHSVYAALETFANVPVFWIGGGRAKGGDIALFAQKIAPKIRAAFLIGETAGTLESELCRANVPAEKFKTLEAAIDAAEKAAGTLGEKRAIVLLSPGFASFDMFSSYAERGLRFVDYVNKFRNES